MALIALLAARPAAGDPSLIVGVADDAMKWHTTDAIAVGSALDLESFRITLRWTAGQTTLAANDAGMLNDVTFRGSRSFRIVLSVFSDDPTDAPVTAAARDAYCTFVRNVVHRYPEINDVVIWNEPNLNGFWQPQFDPSGASAAPAAYEALLAQCYDVLHAVRSGINVIAPATSPSGNDNPWADSNPSHSPRTFIREMGRAYRASGRTQPIFDTVGHHPHPLDDAEPPWTIHGGTTVISIGDWSALMDAVREGFAGTGQPIPGAGVPIWYLEVGYQTAVPSGKGYTGKENAVPGVLPEDEQASQMADAVRVAYCQPYVDAVFNFLLWDDTDLSGWQSGVLWQDGSRKASYESLEQVIGEVREHRVNCDKLQGSGLGGAGAAGSKPLVPVAAGGVFAGASTPVPTAGVGKDPATAKPSKAKATYLAYRGSGLAEYGFSTLAAVLTEATLRGRPARPLANRELRFRVGKRTFTARTDAKGEAVVPLATPLEQGSFVVRVSFAGDATHRAATATERLEIRRSRAQVASAGLFRTKAGSGKLDVRFNGRRMCGFVDFDTAKIHLRSGVLRGLGVSSDGAEAWLTGSGRNGRPFVVYVHRPGPDRGTFRLWVGGQSRTGKGELLAGSVRIKRATSALDAHRLPLHQVIGASCPRDGGQ